MKSRRAQWSIKEFTTKSVLVAFFWLLFMSSYFMLLAAELNALNYVLFAIFAMEVAKGIQENLYNPR